MHKLRSTGRRVKKADEGAVLAELKAILRLPGRPEALTALDNFRERWGRRYPQMVAGWLEHSTAILRFFDYPEPLRPVIRSTNLLERLIKEVKRSTKVRDNTFPMADSVLQVIYFVAGRYQERFEGRKLKGFGQAAEDIRAMFASRYP